MQSRGALVEQFAKKEGEILLDGPRAPVESPSQCLRNAIQIAPNDGPFLIRKSKAQLRHCSLFLLVCCLEGHLPTGDGIMSIDALACTTNWRTRHDSNVCPLPSEQDNVP